MAKIYHLKDETISLKLNKDKDDNVKNDDFKVGEKIGQKEKTPKKKLPPYAMLGISFAIAIVIFVLGFLMIRNMIYLPVDLFNDTAVQVEIPKGSSVSKIASILEEKGLIRNGTVFKFYVDFSDAASKLRAGTYFLSKNMTMKDIMFLLSQGSDEGLVTTFTVTEGSTVEDIANILLDEGILTSSDEFLELAKSGESYSDYSFIADLSDTGTEPEDGSDDSAASSEIQYSNGSAKYALEGYLFPDTYEIYTDSSADTIIKKMLNRFPQIFNDVYLARAEELNMSINDVVILASIIEREGKTKDFKKISAVFHNRLEKGMSLESCATVQYILGTRKLYLSDADISIDSPYNTYKYAGLPVGAICNPGKSAIEAALYPDETYLKEKYLYFCTADPSTGELVFAKTLKEHQENTAKYKDLWIEYDNSNEE
ncbi:MAG: endolytic transglycosylase MltG [Eubacteriales bacterium]